MEEVLLKYLNMVPWVTSGFVAGVLVLVTAFWLKARPPGLMIKYLCGCLILLIAGNLYWFSSIDRRGGRTTAAAWRLHGLRGYGLPDLWRGYPERIGILGPRMEAYLVLRKYCRGASLLLMAGSLSDMGLSEKYLLELAQVAAIRQGAPKNGLSFHLLKQRCQGVEEITMSDGLLFKFCVRADDGQPAVLVWMQGREVFFALPAQKRFMTQSHPRGVNAE
jgi:hypothetical protein